MVLVRDGDKTIITMESDFSGSPKDFAVVIPVPTRIEKGQIHVGDERLVDHLDKYSAPRLVRYYDRNPCAQRRRYRAMDEMPAPAMAKAASKPARHSARSLGVTIEARYAVGDYDILILSAKQSSGLITWLSENGYKIPAGAGEVVGSYLKQQMHFFVAKVNLKRHAASQSQTLKPLQVAYETPKFMLPIRLGTVNAKGPQDLSIFAITRTGRVETTNYPTVKLPTGMQLPVYLEQGGRFGTFYQAMFKHQAAEHQNRAVFLEYAWNMSSCDPCSASPLNNQQLRGLGVFWVSNPYSRQVYLTRLHVRYDGDHFPEDLRFQVTGNTANFQARYVMQEPWKGSRDQCPAAAAYFDRLEKQQHQRAKALAELTGWQVPEIEKQMGLTHHQPHQKHHWWNSLWK